MAFAALTFLFYLSKEYFGDTFLAPENYHQIGCYAQMAFFQVRSLVDWVDFTGNFALTTGFLPDSLMYASLGLSDSVSHFVCPIGYPL